jgi:hypothetical protein
MNRILNVKVKERYDNSESKSFVQHRGQFDNTFNFKFSNEDLRRLATVARERQLTVHYAFKPFYQKGFACVNGKHQALPEFCVYTDDPVDFYEPLA